MIVADTNIISYLFLPTNYSEKASQLFQVDSEWTALNFGEVSSEMCLRCI